MNFRKKNIVVIFATLVGMGVAFLIMHFLFGYSFFHSIFAGLASGVGVIISRVFARNKAKKEM